MKGEQPGSSRAYPHGTRPADFPAVVQLQTKKSVPSPQPITVPEKKGIVPADLITVPRRRTDPPPQRSTKKK